MTFDDIKKHYRGIENARKDLGLSRSYVYHWAEIGVPPGWQARIELLTGGKLKADPKVLRAA